MVLLARTEGIFAETAGGVTVAVARKLIEQGRIPRDEEIVLCITGNGLKTQDAVAGLPGAAGDHRAVAGGVRAAGRRQRASRCWCNECLAAICGFADATLPDRRKR